MAGTLFDLNTATLLNDTIFQVSEYPDFDPGYDVNYVLFGLTGEEAANRTVNGKLFDEPQHAATIMAAETGLTLDVSTTSPGLQFYTAGLLKSQNPLLGKNGVAYPQFSGLTVETQNFPNAINQPNFPSMVLRPGDTYTNVVVWRFSNSTTG